MRIGRSFIVGLVLLAFIASFGDAAASEDKAIRVSINSDNQMRVPLTINGQTSFGIVDTGATFPLIDMALIPEPELLTEQGTVVVQGLSGTVDYDVATVASIQIGENRMEAVRAGVNDETRFPGLLNVIPADAFPHRVIDFDFQDGVISLYDDRPIKDHRDYRTKVSYEEIQRLPFIQVWINNTPGLALIDTGSNSTFINSAFADKAKTRNRADLVKDLFGVDAEATQARIAQIRRLRVGGHRVSKLNVLVADPDLFDTLGVAERPVMIIGLDLLKHFRVQIDRQDRHIYLGR
ncbi:MAG: retropepsin-like aspartic protease [Pseudomonadota bacterium]